MSFYGIIVLLHVIGAVCGIGAQFALPFLTSKAKTAKQAEFVPRVNHGIDKLIVIGTFMVLITGLIMGAMHPQLFTRGW